MASLSALLLLAISSLTSMASAGNLYKDLDITWGNGRGKILNGGHLLTLSLDKSSGSGFQSRNQYLFGRIDMQIRLVAGNSAGTVTTYYMRSPGWSHDEIDFEFLGNLSGHPYTLHTNIFTLGKGGREQQFRLWFDPTKHFHTYSILWNPRHVILLVDGVPIRDFRNLGSRGAGFPAGRPMRVYASLWNADDWATQGGRVKTDWRRAPFTAAFRNFNANGCVATSAACAALVRGSHTAGRYAWMNQGLDPASQKKLRWVRTNYMIYNYCDDRKRFPKVSAPECYV